MFPHSARPDYPRSEAVEHTARRWDGLSKYCGSGLFSCASAGGGRGDGQQGAARQPCAADIQQLCADVKPGDGRLKACVKEHFGKLSASRQTAVISNVTITKSCKADAEQKCSGIQPGGGHIQAA
jgi:Cysteine rich repeat